MVNFNVKVTLVRLIMKLGVNNFAMYLTMSI
jgi:hypothetical protein